MPDRRLSIQTEPDARLASREAESLYRCLFESAGDAILVVRGDRFIDCNRRALEMYRCSREELLEQTPTGFSLPTQPDGGNSIEKARELLAAASAGQPSSFYWQHRLTDGTILDAEVTLTRVDGSAEPLLLALVKDITARKRAEDERMRLVTAVEQAVDDIIITDAAGNIEYCNPASERITGYSRAEIVGRNMRILKSGKHDEAFYRNLWSTITSGRVWTGRFTNKRKDGRLIEEEATISPIQDETATVRGFVSVKRDVTEKLELEARLRQAQRMEAIGQLAGGIAHDFNNLLTVINGYSDLLLKKLEESDPVRSSLVEIRRAGERASGLTQQLLAFSRRQVLEPRVLEASTVLRETESMFRRLIGEDIELVTKFDSAGLVRTDPGQLQQVVLNLVLNARDAMPGGGKLVLETADVSFDESYAEHHPEVKPGPYVLLAVSDTGTGMTPEVKRRLFEPFFTTKEPGKGTGLGLSTAFGIVRQSGGYIWVYSEPGTGTTFKVYFPRVAGKEPVEDPQRSSNASLRGSETVLIVEDQPEVRRVACQVLRNYGYSVLEAPGGPEALALLEQCAEPIHLLLTDVVMPGMNGRGLADRIKPLRPDMKVLFMSGYTDTVIVQGGVLGSQAPYLQKPFSPDALARKVRHVLTSERPRTTILVADDEPSIQQLVRHILEEAGYNVLTAGNGREAIDTVRKHRVDVLITDLVMPEREGIETIQELRGTHPNLKMIAMSGAYGGSYLHMAAMMGAVAALKKPLNAELLLNTVRTLLGR